MKQPDLSIIIPAYQEANELGGWIRRVINHLDTHNYGKVELLIIPQTSADAAEARKAIKTYANARVIELKKRAGKGGAVRVGIFEATGKYRLFMDADLATPLNHLDDVKTLMDRNGEVGIAVRNLVSIHSVLLRKIITGIGNLLAQIVLLPGISDTQCGFKVFRADVAEAVFSRQTITGWGFDLEILAVARKLGYTIETFPAPDWSDPKEAGLVGDSAAGAALGVLRELFRIRWGLITGKYNQKSYTHETKVKKGGDL